MSSYELVSPEDYEALPADPEECFVALETICHRNMMAIIHEDTSNDFDAAVRMEYVAIITAFAQECGVTEVVAAYGPADTYQDFSRFLLVVRGAVAKIRFRNRGVSRSTTVLLLANTKTKIEHYISRLEHAIAASDLPDNRKKILAQKIDDFRAELARPRLGMGKTFAVLSAIIVGLSSATTIAADGPNAITHIMQLIGKDRETEEAAAERLSPPPKALAAPVLSEQVAAAPPRIKQSSSGWDTLPHNDLDDEIPF